MWLTNHGNILAKKDDQFAFFSANGTFLRECTEKDAIWLTQDCHKISSDTLEQSLNWPNKMPFWHYLLSFRCTEDFTNYKPETGCNGGDYAIFTDIDILIAETPKGWEFRTVSLYSSSAEFRMDELTGGYNEYVKETFVVNADRKYLSGQEDNVVVLEQISDSITWSQISNLATLTFNEGYQNVAPISDETLTTIKSKSLNIGVPETVFQKKVRR